MKHRKYLIKENYYRIYQTNFNFKKSSYHCVSINFQNKIVSNEIFFAFVFDIVIRYERAK